MIAGTPVKPTFTLHPQHGSRLAGSFGRGGA